MAVLAILVVLISVPLMVFTKLVCDAPLLIPNPVGAVHVYKVPAGTIPFVISVGVLLKATPLQLVAVMAVI